MWWLSARVWAAAIAVLGLSNSVSLGACTTNDITSITVSGTGLASYNPFVASTPRQLTINVASNVACSVELAFQTSATPARLQGPGTPLTYDVQLPSTTTSLLFAAGMPTTTTRIDIGAGNVGTATVQVALPTNQIVASGAYNDANLVAHIYDKSTAIFGAPEIGGRANLDDRCCRLPIPDADQSDDQFFRRDLQRPAQPGPCRIGRAVVAELHRAQSRELVGRPDAAHHGGNRRSGLR